MAKRQTDPTEDEIEQEPEDTRTPDEKFADRIAKGVAAGIAATAPARKTSYAQYDPKSPNQKGIPKKEMPKLTRVCFQNGQLMDADKMNADEIRLMNALTIPGRYVDRRVEVIIREESGEGVVELRYSDTINQSFQLRGQVRVAKYDSPLANMLQHIVDESTATGIFA